MSAKKKARKKSASRKKPSKPARSKPARRKSAGKKPASRKAAAKKPAVKPAKAAKPAVAKPAAAAPQSLLGALPAADAAKLKALVRTAWFPKAQAGTTTGPATRIGGAPWLPEGESWPVCPNCSHPMAFILQLDLASLPAGAPSFGDGLAQLFYCLNTEPEICEVDCEAFFPFAKSVVARVVSKTGGADSPLLTAPNAPAPKKITGWEPREDLSNSEELGGLGVEADYDGPLYQALQKAEVPRAGDKLGGWPHWVQGVEYPDCPTCKEPMRLVMQIDSGDVVGPQWGDMGCAHLTQCATHPGQLAFGWACG